LATDTVEDAPFFTKHYRNKRERGVNGDWAENDIKGIVRERRGKKGRRLGSM